MRVGGGSARAQGVDHPSTGDRHVPNFYRRHLSEDERTARRNTDRDRLEQAARALLTTDGWQRWIKVHATNGLSRYTLLIWRGDVIDGL